MQVGSNRTRSSADDLRFIQGITGRIENVLKKAGYKNFEKIATAKTSKLNAVLAKAGITGKVPFIKSWADQAKLASSGRWSDLVNKQKKLKKA